MPTNSSAQTMVKKRLKITVCTVLLHLLLWPLTAIAESCVILLHGMARTDASMTTIEEELASEGYRVVNYGYPSTEFNIQTLAAKYPSEAIAKCGEVKAIHFVTHSLGGIILRKYLSDNKIAKLGRVVMLGPPNQGSEVVDKLKNLPGFEWINGPAGQELGTGEQSVPNTLGPVDYPVGIIAGNKTFNPLLSLLLPNPDDGKVSVARTKVEGMSDHIVIPTTHTFMMRNQQVISQVKAFLATGVFTRTAPSQ